MGCKLIGTMIAMGAVAVVCNFGPAGTGQAQAGDHHRSSPELFYNYYVPPGGCGGVGAQLYLSPRPTPPVVGHTYVTYPPLMPHEWLYPHSRTYIRRNAAGGITRTHVTWTRSLFDFGWLHGERSLLPSPPLTPKRSFHAGWAR
ncbi:hypothetical protein LCGC14_2737470 [marine sediment metagenome]|uniref:Uncharacterized protein n=1 Tax=marine sediment metagenome TaxID=412755 RepID=A0A0F8ZSP7_9ZZZZ